jgi:tRNA threonylcarbamoyladenosine biosynthesis protein TsaB
VIVAGIDTATGATVAAVMRADGSVREARDDPPAGTRPAHASRLLALLEQVLAEAETGWGDVTRLAVGVGPGGFTGLRIGIATARGLAQAHGLDLVPVSSLAALGRVLRGGAPGPAAQVGDAIAAAIDARRGEVYGAAWDDGMPVVPAAAYAPEDFARRVAGLRVVGDGAVAHRAAFEEQGCHVAPDTSRAHLIEGAWVCRLGRAGAPVARDALLPDYRRDPDAVPPSRP